MEGCRGAGPLFKILVLQAALPKKSSAAARTSPETAVHWCPEDDLLVGRCVAGVEALPSEVFAKNGYCK